MTDIRDEDAYPADTPRRHASAIAGSASGGAAFSPGMAARRSIDLARNESPFGPSPLALQAVQDATSEIARYTGADAHRLEHAIAAREGVAAEQIILGEILDSLGLQLALDGGPGGEFIYSEPGYMALVDAVGAAGGVVVGVPLDADLKNDLAAIAARVSRRTRAVYVVNPHSPTGTTLDPGVFKSFLRDVAEHTNVVVDEAYLEYEPEFARNSAVEITREGGNVIVFRTFSKIYGLAGLSIGYAVAPRRLADRLKRNGLGAPHSLNRLAVAAAAASLRDTTHIERISSKVREEREKWHALLGRLGRRHSDARGNFVFFETGQPHATVAAALRSAGIEIGRANPPLDQWVRVSIGLPGENDLARDAVARLFG